MRQCTQLFVCAADGSQNTGRSSAEAGAAAAGAGSNGLGSAAGAAEAAPPRPWRSECWRNPSIAFAGRTGTACAWSRIIVACQSDDAILGDFRRVRTRPPVCVYYKINQQRQIKGWWVGQKQITISGAAGDCASGASGLPRGSAARDGIVAPGQRASKTDRRAPRFKITGRQRKVCKEDRLSREY